MGHKLRGAAAVVGGESVASTAGAVEAAARAGDLQRVRAKLAELNHQVERLRSAMEASPLRGGLRKKEGE
jgi:HPt (histidine-containing phosphotransfer) domain-containing protein